MIGTTVIESLVQATALSHRIDGHKRVSLLLIAAPESGKTTIATSATAKHICRVAVISGRSILQQANTNPLIEFLLFNDLSSVRAMSSAAVNLLVVILNQVTQDEPGIVAFAGKEVDHIRRPLGLIGCIPFKVFTDHRAKWRELGFVSRMIPFAYQYPRRLVATIKDGIDLGHGPVNRQSRRKMPAPGAKRHKIAMNAALTRKVRHLADIRAEELQQLGIRLLQNYHCLIRAHALLHHRRTVTLADFEFLQAIDSHVSITTCRDLKPL